MVSKVLFSSNTGEWSTPPELYEVLNKEFHFNLDPCTTIDNPLGTDWYYIKEMDGLKQNWFGNVYVNPPYGSTVTEWLEKGIQQLPNCYVVVYLLPARTDTKWFHHYVYNDYSHTWWSWVKEVRFLKGRLKFGGAKNTAPFPSMVVIFHPAQFLNNRKSPVQLLNIDRILGWNECIDVLFENGIIDSKDLVKIWQVTTPKQKQEEYLNK